jgi:hypothetical protein
MIRDENIIMDLTGVTINQLSLIIYNSSKVPIGTGMGTFTVISTSPGTVTYAPASADVLTSGSYYLRVKVNFNNTSPDYSDYIPWTIQA